MCISGKIGDLKSDKEIFHIDGTVCFNKRTVAGKAKIIQYWENTAHVYLGCDIDVDFPGCCACGYDGFRERDDEVDSYKVLNKQFHFGFSSVSS